MAIPALQAQVATNDSLGEQRGGQVGMCIARLLFCQNEVSVQNTVHVQHALTCCVVLWYIVLRCFQITQLELRAAGKTRFYALAANFGNLCGEEYIRLLGYG